MTEDGTVVLDSMPTPVDNDTSEIEQISCKIISYYQGDEDSLGTEVLKFFVEEEPKIIYQTTWVIGIKSYFMFVYR